MKILIVEDEPISRRLLQANLTEWGYEVMVASDGEEAWKFVQGPEAPNLLISDWVMPRMDGLTLCQNIRRMKKGGYTYFILLTAKGGQEDVLQGLEAGADDFLVKPFNQEELKYRTRIGERIIDLEHRIMELANTDPLTRVLNRRAFMERLAAESQRCQRVGTPFSILLIDIDHFKKVNDRYGHQTGDRVLEMFAARLADASRPYDFVGRYGGEEFIVCMSNVTSATGASIAERIRAQVERLRVELPDGSGDIGVTASFGVATADGAASSDIEDLIRKADKGLYRAKDTGRNRVCTV